MFNLDRFDLARARRQITAKALSERSGVSAVTLSRIGKGSQNPDPETVEKIAQALGYPVEYFYADQVEIVDEKTVSFRSLASMSAREKKSALSAGSSALDLSEWAHSKFNLPECDLPEIDADLGPENAAEVARKYWGLGEKPLGNMIMFLEAKGVRVFSLAEQTANVDAFSFWKAGEPFIFLNTMKTGERSRFDAAHELGHLLLHKLDQNLESKEKEREADRFASAFLMPRDGLLARIRYPSRLDEIIAEKSVWRVSAKALVYRLHKLGHLSDWQNRNFNINLNKRYGRSEPNGIQREHSFIWKKMFESLWDEGLTKESIAEDLKLPVDEIDALTGQLLERPQGPVQREAGLRLVD